MNVVRCSLLLVNGILDYRYGYANAIGVLMFVIGLMMLGIVNKAFRMEVSD